MTNRDLSEKLCKIACELGSLSETSKDNSEHRRILIQIASELHELSNEKFSPGASWDDLKKKAQENKKQPYTSSTGKKLPF